MAERSDVFTALTAECDELDSILHPLEPAAWTSPTPAEGWTVSDQVAHLAATFRLAGLAASSPKQFSELAATLGPDFDSNVRHAMAGYLGDEPEVLYQRWQSERFTAVKALAAAPQDELVPWLVNPLPPSVLAAAGMTEAFAHGQDIRDALQVDRHYTDRLYPIVAFGVRTWNFGYLARELAVPAKEFRFELTAPSGAVWEFGSPESANSVSGSASDFCLLVTRRRHRNDLGLVARGHDAEHWLDIAQAYRGPSGAGRSAGQFPR